MTEGSGTVGSGAVVHMARTGISGSMTAGTLQAMCGAGALARPAACDCLRTHMVF
jgi:hypothetical protein